GARQRSGGVEKYSSIASRQAPEHGSTASSSGPDSRMSIAIFSAQFMHTPARSTPQPSPCSYNSTCEMSLRGSRSKSKQKQFDHKVAYPRLIKSLWHVSAGTRRGRARSIVGPARKYLQTRSALKKEGSEPPLPRSLSAAGFVSHSRRQLFAN